MGLAGGGAWPRAGIALAAIVLLAAAYLSVRNAAILLTARTAPHAALNFPPAAGEALMRMQLPPRRPSPEEVRAAIAKGAPRAPLSQLPFLLEAQIAQDQGQTERAAGLNQEALRRESRSEYGRARTLQSYLLLGEWAPALDEMRRMWNANRRSQPVLTQALTVLASSDVRARALLLRKLDEDPRWRNGFTSAVRKRDRRSPLLATIRDYRTGAAAGPVTLDAQGFQNWVAALPAEDLGKVGLVYDGGFDGGSNGSPFAWTLAGEGRARVDRNALQIGLAGGSSGVLAQQHLVLPVARYRVNVSYDTESGLQLAWTLGCIGGGTIGRVPLPAGDQRASAIVPIEPGCPIQRLSLIGSGEGRAVIDRIEIVPAL